MGDEEGFWRRINHSLEVDDGFEQTWLILGDVRAMKGDLPGAAEAYRKALEIVPRMPQVWNALARIYLQQGQNDQAVEALNRSLELEPTGAWAWDAHRLLAIAYYQMGLPEMALAEAQTALQMAPEDQKPAIEQLIGQLQPTMPVTP